MALSLGKTEKLVIQPYIDAAYEKKAPSGNFTALINPETYTYKYKIEFCETQAPGTSGVALKFNKMPPQDFNFDFLFDGTGVVKDATVLDLAIANPFGGSRTVSDQLNDFRQKVLEYKGDVHRPYYLKIIWGTSLFKGVLVAMDIEFRLFNPDGLPIRAVAKCTFKGTIEEKLRVAKENAQSPDITHKRLFTASDKLTLLTKDIYNNQNYYTDVAKFNQLDGFRKINPGTEVYFPKVQ